MMELVVGIGNLLVGAAYVGLGLLSGWEAASQYRYRGLSRFGLGFSLMAASCGPHHLVHGWCALNGAAVSMPMLIVTLVGVPAGVVFCWLRLEVLLGGRGDRTVTASPTLMLAAAMSWLILVGALAGWVLATPPLPSQEICTAQGVILAAAQSGPSVNLILLSNLFVTCSYAMVGWYLFATQIRRYAVSRSWSLSGLALAAIFPTCAAMHLIVGLTNSQDTATLWIDLWGVPASIYFLWIVKRLYMDSVVDWNRRPLLGVAATPGRQAPWNDIPSAR